MDYSIKDLPQSERPREKLEENGVSSLTEVELLSLILRAGTSGKNVKELSAEILNSYSLSELPERPLEELKDFQGVSRVKAGQLKAVGELARRLQREEREIIKRLSDLEDRVRDMKFLQEEKLRIFALSSGNKLLKEEEIDGNVDSVNFEPRKVFEPAVRAKASAIILAHNHPSGSPEATEDDLRATEELIKAGESLGITLLDHVIIGNEITSMKSETSLSF